MNAPSTRHAPLNGEVTYDGAFARIFFQRRIPHPPERVWEAITDPDELSKWFMADGTIEGRAGGSMDMRAGPSKIPSHGKVLVWDPPKVLEYEWKTGPRAEIPKGEDSFVRWTLAAVEGETVLTLEHRRISRPTAAGFAPGWHTFLDRLLAQLEGSALPDWVQRFTLLRNDYP